jgi:hypothetical protein
VGGEEVNGVVVAADDGDIGVALRKSVGDAPEESGDVPVGMGGCDCVEDGAADVACSACAVVDVNCERRIWDQK